MPDSSTHPVTGQSVRFGTEIITFKALAADTNGAYSLFEGRTLPQEGTPLHVQHLEDEAFVVLEGTYRFQIGEKILELGPGQFAFVPKNTAHAYQNLGAGVGRLLIIVSPGGFHEQFFAEIGEPIADPAAPPPPSGPPDFGKIIAAGQKYGVEIMPPSAQ